MRILVCDGLEKAGVEILSAAQGVTVDERPAIDKFELAEIIGIDVGIDLPHTPKEFIELHGFWLPGHVKSVTSSFLLGPTNLEIQFSNYQLEPPEARGN